MKAKILVDLDNDAFKYGGPQELAQILRELASRIERRDTFTSPIGLLDHNGNNVGTFLVGENLS